MLPSCRRHVVPTQDVAPILARWVRVADTRFKMSGPFVSATADTNFSRQNPSAYVETYVWYVSYICTLKLKTRHFYDMSAIDNTTQNTTHKKKPDTAWCRRHVRVSGRRVGKKRRNVFKSNFWQTRKCWHFRLRLYEKKTWRDETSIP